LVTAVYRGGREVALGVIQPSLAGRTLALAFRRIELLRRFALRAHSIRHRLRSTQVQCRA
jgi:hypothetical protein